MKDASFALDYWTLPVLIFLGAALVLLLRLRKQFSEPCLLFSSVNQPKTYPKTFSLSFLRQHYQHMPQVLHFAALSLFAIAFINLKIFVPYREDSNVLPLPREGIAIYLILDQSGSMKEEVFIPSTVNGTYRTSKIDALKQTSKQFIIGDKTLGLAGRPNDMIGLVFFARGAKIASPLTLDHESILDQLGSFHEVQDPDQDGTAIGYALYKTADLISATKQYLERLNTQQRTAYEIKNYVIILITDGLQDPNPADAGKRLRNIDIPEAAQYIKDIGAKLYVVNVDPKLSTEEYLPYQHIMQRAAALSGGKYFGVTEEKGLEEIYRDIDRLEKSTLPSIELNKEERPDLYHKISFYPYFLASGLFLLFTSLLLETYLLRKTP